MEKYNELELVFVQKCELTLGRFAQILVDHVINNNCGEKVAQRVRVRLNKCVDVMAGRCEQMYYHESDNELFRRFYDDFVNYVDEVEDLLVKIQEFPSNKVTRTRLTRLTQRQVHKTQVLIETGRQSTKMAA